MLCAIRDKKMKRFDLTTILLLVSALSAFGQFNRSQRTIEPTDTLYYKEYIEAKNKFKPAELSRWHDGIL